ncbi:hypothetical protein [Nocardia higoensis]|uniref:hypothetical protein n=1 Tax=Nocardia higoensis TaxID=228599 RepID=UPI0012F6A92F|nr:hypothetical protein [Nocardia higoensis]
MSRETFAAHTGVSSEAVRKWERRRETIELTAPYAARMDRKLRQADAVDVERFWAILDDSAAGNTDVEPQRSAGPDIDAGHHPAALLESGCLESRAVAASIDLRHWVNMNRRQLLELFGGAAGVSALATMLGGLDSDEADRITAALLDPARVDGKVVDHLEASLEFVRGQNDLFGPEVVLPTVNGHILVAEAVLREHSPASLRLRVHRIHGDLARLAGWMEFDLRRYAPATARYNVARDAAHAAEDAGLAALTLCNLAYLEIWRGRPRLGVDFAAAAIHWASRVEDPRLAAYTHGIAALGYAHANRPDDCYTALDSADSAIANTTNSDQESTTAYFVSAGLIASLRADALHRLGEHRPAHDAAQQALAHLAPGQIRNQALARLDLARGYTHLGDIEAAADNIAAGAELAADYRSPRLDDTIRAARTDLRHWDASACVRDLDSTLASLGLIPA